MLILEVLEEEDKVRRIFVRQRLDEKRVDEGENRGRRTDPERESEDADQGEERIFREQAKSVT